MLPVAPWILVVALAPMPAIILITIHLIHRFAESVRRKTLLECNEAASRLGLKIWEEQGEIIVRSYWWPHGTDANFVTGLQEKIALMMQDESSQSEKK